MEFSVTILGINSAKPAYNRNQTAQLVHHHLEDYLIDCGEGTQLQLVKFQKKMSKIRLW
jgi:ribonuclease Z